MDKELFKQSIREAKKLRLTVDEKNAVRQSIFNFISLHPVRSLAHDKVVSPKDLGEATSYGTSPVRVSPEPRLGFWSTILSGKLNLTSTMAVLLIIFVLVGGGVSLGAEKASPGDTLYPVKIGVNEEVRGWLSASEESKADWEVKRVQRRLEEAEKMAENGSLDSETRARIEANFEAHTEKVNKRIEKFEEKENFKAAADVSAKFEASLKAHQKILDRLTGEVKEDVKKEVRPIQVRVRSEADNLTKIRQRMELKLQSNIDLEVDTDEDQGGKDDDRGGDDSEVNIENKTNLEIEAGNTKGSGSIKVEVGL